MNDNDMGGDSMDSAMANEQIKPPTVMTIDVLTLIAAACVIVAVLGTGVALSLSGMPVEAIVALLTGMAAICGTLIAILGKLSTVHRVNAVQDQKLQKIETQTNGTLQAVIRDEISKAMSLYFKPEPPKETENN